METTDTQQQEAPTQSPQDKAVAWIDRGRKLANSLSEHTPEVAEIAGSIVHFAVKTVVKTVVRVKEKAVQAYTEGVAEGKA
jgi:hypothetical protein